MGNSGRVVGVHDGDSITVLTAGNVQLKTRLVFFRFRNRNQAGLISSNSSLTSSPHAHPAWEIML